MRVYLAVWALCLIAVIMTCEPNYSARFPKGDSQENTQNNAASHPASDYNSQPSQNHASANNNPPKWNTSPEWWLVILGFPTLVILIAQAIVSGYAAKAALQNTTAFLHSERPWLSLKTAVSGPLVFDEQAARVTLDIKVENIGKMPAMSVWISPAFFIPSPQKHDVGEERRRMCENMRKTGSIGSTVFPGEPYVRRYIIQAQRSDIMQACREIFGNVADEAEMFPAMIIVVVGYRTGIDKDAFYYTAANYDLQRMEANLPTVTLALKMETTPMERLALLLHPIRSIIAE